MPYLTSTPHTYTAFIPNLIYSSIFSSSYPPTHQNLSTLHPCSSCSIPLASSFISTQFSTHTQVPLNSPLIHHAILLASTSPFHFTQPHRQPHSTFCLPHPSIHFTLPSTSLHYLFFPAILPLTPFLPSPSPPPLPPILFRASPHFTLSSTSQLVLPHSLPYLFHTPTVPSPSPPCLPVRSSFPFSLDPCVYI